MNNDGKPRPVYRALTKLAFELVAVIAGILIALFVSNLQERKHDKELLEGTLSSLVKEFDKNIANIRSKQLRIERFRDTLKFYDQNMSLSISDLTLKSPGLTAVELYTTNWQTSLSTNSLRLLDFETVTKLSQIDAKHKEMNDQALMLTNMIFNTAVFRTGKEGMEHRKILGWWIDAYLGNINELEELYNQFDTMVGSDRLQFRNEFESTRMSRESFRLRQAIGSARCRQSQPVQWEIAM